jgi:hypothetical protein
MKTPTRRDYGILTPNETPKLGTIDTPHTQLNRVHSIPLILFL